MRPGWLGPLRGCPSPLTPFGLSFSPLVCLPPLFLFHSEGGPLTWVPPSSSSLSPLHGSLTHWPRTPARPEPPRSPPSRPCVPQSPPQTWLRPRRSWAVGLGSTASQGTPRPPRLWLLPSRRDRRCRWNSFGTTGPQVRGTVPLKGWHLPAARVRPLGGDGCWLLGASGGVSPCEVWFIYHLSCCCSFARGPGVTLCV